MDLGSVCRDTQTTGLIPGPMDLLNLSLSRYALDDRIESQDLRFPEALRRTWDQSISAGKTAEAPA